MVSGKSIFIALALFSFACGANEGVLKSGRPSSDNTTAQPARSAFEQDFRDILETEYTYIFVLRRKDGAVLDADDKAFIRANIVQANRRVVTDEDRAVLIGSNNAVPPDKMLAVYGRFAVDNYSRGRDANANSKP